MTSIPREKKRWPEGVTRYHLPSTFSARKLPVAVNCGPSFHPPYSSHEAGADLSAAVSVARSLAKALSSFTFSGHASWMNWP